MNNLEFGSPWFFLLAAVIPVFIYLKYKKRKSHTLTIPNLSAFKAKNRIGWLYSLLFWMRVFVLVLLICTLARPRVINMSQSVEYEKGIDIMMTIDVSLSMLAKDLEPDRLTALKEVAVNFAQKRLGDRIGLIAYSEEALTLVPLTTDRSILIQQIFDLKAQMLEGGTAIGNGLATAINHIKDSKAKSKVIILMTDGANNSGMVDPEEAADIALKKGIKIYTIGVGSNGFALFPEKIFEKDKIYFEKKRVEIDEDLLKNIARKTGGEYFRATNSESLKDIYENINQLEKSEINDVKYYNYTEKYRLFLLPALCLLLLELFLRTFVFRSLT